jgi:methylenetetrahydrofolate--tRNA-(uracil-5-)-methyltransferase
MKFVPDFGVTVIGAGLAGSEAAYQCSRRGVPVVLWEQRPAVLTEAHQTGDFAELVCSNSLKSLEPTNAHGLLKAELELLDSLLLRIARETAIPGGKALVVDRARFASRVTEEVSCLPGVTVRREPADHIPGPGPVVIAAGPLTSPALADELARLLGADNLAFYDAISPIVDSGSIDRARCFAANRYLPGEDYLNCPLTEPGYDAFYRALISAELFPLRDFEGARCFEGCLPIEDLARRGRETLLYGPMKPVGLIDPETGRRPFCVVQLRRENAQGTMYNLVGFQTRMTRPEQRRVLGIVPALARADFLRFGSVHRNTFVNAPLCLLPTLQTRTRPDLFIAGQLSGVEGYVESIATGLIVGINAARLALGRESIAPASETMLGALLNYITTPRTGFQPMNANFGLLPGLEARRRERQRAYADRALEQMREFAQQAAG